MFTVSGLFIYPIKSLGGIAINETALSSTGFHLDRKWMLVGEEDNTFLSQRTLPELALFQVKIEGDDLIITHKIQHNKQFQFNTRFHSDEKRSVHIWEDECEAYVVSDEANRWFSEMLNSAVKLVYMPETTKRKVDPDFVVEEGNYTGFSDAYPILMLSEASLELLNSKLSEPLGYDRFRANLIIKGLEPHMEDEINLFEINGLSFQGVKPCARCVMTTIDQQTGKSGKEPLKTLSEYRQKDKKIYFGQNVIGPDTGKIKIGDTLTVIKRSYS